MGVHPCRAPLAMPPVLETPPKNDLMTMLAVYEVCELFFLELWPSIVQTERRRGTVIQDAVSIYIVFIIKCVKNYVISQMFEAGRSYAAAGRHEASSVRPTD